jgi:hypothetical protein
MEHGFKVEVGSAEPIAKALLNLWGETSREEEGSAEVWEEKAEKARGKTEAKIKDLKNVNEDENGELV